MRKLKPVYSMPQVRQEPSYLDSGGRFPKLSITTTVNISLTKGSASCVEEDTACELQ